MNSSTHRGQPIARRLSAVRSVPRRGSHSIGFTLACLAASLLLGATSELAAAEPPASIGRWLARNCLECHSSREHQGGLDLTRRDRALAGGDSGPGLVPGKPAESLIWQRVSAGEMPPKHPLPAAERAALEAWLAAGAKWDVDPIDPLEFSSDRRGGRDWWSWQPLPTRPLPAARHADRARTAVDLLLQQRLAAANLTPAPDASRPALLRRLSFDLLGLPPTPEEVAEFVADEAPDAVERQVDRLLASPRCGERWARHWLDLAHFGESDGFEYDRLRPNAWPYRDWVIEALNRDLPYDEFARQQIAGDVFQPADPAAITATGFLVGGAFDGLQPAVELMRQIMRQDELEDLVATLGQTFLGVTLQCARCHDHKFDPIAQPDYYRIAAALAGVRRGERELPPTGRAAQAQRQWDQVTAELRKLEDRARGAALARRRGGTTPADQPAPPQPIAAWDFTRDLRDRIGALHGVTHGNARLDAAGLVVDGTNAYVTTAPLAAPLQAKTLAAVVQLANLDQRGGGVIGVQAPDGSVFDSIVYGEKDPGQWMPGSNGFERTKQLGGPVEQRAKDQAVHVAIAYDADGTIRTYVDGKPYGQSYKTTLRTFAAGQTQVVFGMRHAPPGGNRMLAGVIRNGALYDRALSADEIAAAARSQGEVVSEAELVAELTPAEVQKRRDLQSSSTALRGEMQRFAPAKAFAITPIAPPVTHVLARGNPRQTGDIVAPGGIQAIRGLSSDFHLSADAGDADRRRQLAAWIASRDNPLFSRTIANRLWQYHFGIGIVPTPNDLGYSGGQPTHPELLDWLAAELGRREFSLKALHRLLVTSTAYRQSSAPRREALAVDADNRLVWRMSPRRLEAEVVRDAILTVSGQLNLAAGGPGYQDFRPFLRGGTQFYEPLDPVGPGFNRRSIYRTWARGGHNALLDTFDCPDPSTITPRRSVTTTPLQALSLLNNSFILRMAEHFADRLTADTSGDLDAAVDRAFALTCARAATTDERAAALPFVREHGLAAFCRVLLNSNTFLYVE